MPHLITTPYGQTHTTAWIPSEPAPNGMEIDSPSLSPGPSEDRLPSVASIPTAPSDLQTIMVKLTEIIRQVLGPYPDTATSAIDAPIDHGLLRGVLLDLKAENMKLPEDVGVVISAIQAYLHSGSIDDTNPLVCVHRFCPASISTRLLNEP